MPTYFDGNLVYIHIPKCAGKSVNHSLGAYQKKLCPQLGTGALSFRMHESLYEIQNIFQHQWNEEKWNKAKIISTIRHPIERALSWWKYKKGIELDNQRKLSEWNTPHRFNVKTSNLPLVTPQDHANYNGKTNLCTHRENKAEFERFQELSFDDFTKKMTTWKTSDCPVPDCLYHGLSPQVDWLKDVNGKVPLNKLILFTVDDLRQIQDFLPNMPPLSVRSEDFEDKECKTSVEEHLTTESLMILRRLYAEDFKIYNMLKNRQPGYYKSLDVQKLSVLSSAG